MRAVLFLPIVAILFLSGCSAFMAVDSEPKKNLSVLTPGTKRSVVIGELGNPIDSERRSPSARTQSPQAEAPSATPEPIPSDSSATSLEDADAATARALAAQGSGASSPPQVAYGDGAASVSAADGSERYDIFQFVQGYSSESNAGRAFAYGTLAVLTLGISEVVMTPMEAMIGDGEHLKVKVSYDQEDRVTESRILVGTEWVTVEEYERIQEKRREEPEKPVSHE